MSDDMESASLVARKTSQWRETLRCWVVAGFDYAARATAMREGTFAVAGLTQPTDAVDVYGVADIDSPRR